MRVEIYTVTVAMSERSGISGWVVVNAYKIRRSMHIMPRRVVGVYLYIR